MTSGGLTGEIYRPLSMEQVAKIHDRALDLLEECGMTYEEGLEDVLAALKNGQARVGSTAGRKT